jgi:lysozyme
MNESTKDMIKRHEAYRPYIYPDTEGVPTGGYGHAFHKGSVLPESIWNQIFVIDYQTALDDYEKLELDLDPVRKAVVVDMLFNLGWDRFSEFKNTLKALRAGDWERAACGMENSKWYGQVRTRAVELVRMMRTGEFQA